MGCPLPATRYVVDSVHRVFNKLNFRVQFFASSEKGRSAFSTDPQGVKLFVRGPTLGQEQKQLVLSFHVQLEELHGNRIQRFAVPINWCPHPQQSLLFYSEKKAAAPTRFLWDLNRLGADLRALTSMISTPSSTSAQTFSS